MRASIKFAVATAAILGFSTGASVAGEDAKLVIDGAGEMIIRAPAPAHLTSLDEVISGWVYRATETQALELDDFDNPGFVFVDQAIDTYSMVDGTAGKSCANCHADVSDFEGLRTVLPRVTEDGELWSMENYINDCRVNRMGAEPWKWSSTQMTGMTALISLQSRGLPTKVAIDGPAKSFWERGKELYYTRVGQLDMACANCHEDNYGNMIRADRLSQGQTNGFPVYRLKNGKLNSIHARFKGCMKNIRATPYAEGSEEFKALELYVSSRGTGLSIESPSVRN